MQGHTTCKGILHALGERKHRGKNVSRDGRGNVRKYIIAGPDRRGLNEKMDDTGNRGSGSGSCNSCRGTDIWWKSGYRYTSGGYSSLS